MFYPLDHELSSLKDQELEEKIQNLTKKYHTAYKLGNPQLLTQISNFLIIYKNELSNRLQERSKKDLDGDLNQLINVD
jgi:hypothetical protein